MHAEELLRKKIRDPADFEWLKQCRFYWRDDRDTVIISICDRDFEYSFEYLGVQLRLSESFTNMLINAPYQRSLLRMYCVETRAYCVEPYLDACNCVPILLRCQRALGDHSFDGYMLRNIESSSWHVFGRCTGWTRRNWQD